MIGLVVGGVFAVVASAVIAFLFVRLSRRERGGPRT
jgi:nitric oxide reductase large subunit